VCGIESQESGYVAGRGFLLDASLRTGRIEGVVERSVSE